MGPEGGDEGGTLVAAGTPEEVAGDARAPHTGGFLAELVHAGGTARDARQEASSEGRRSRVIEVVELRKRYAPKAPEAVAGISFEARRGEVFGLLGPERSGQDDDDRGADDARAPDVRVRRDRRHRRAGGPCGREAAHRGRAAAAQPRPAAQGDREPHVPRGLLRLRPRRAAQARAGGHEGARPGGPRGRGRQQPLRRHGPAPAHRTCAHAPPAGPLPRRAHDRPGSAVAALPVGPHRGAARGGHDDPAHDARHGRGRPALRQHRDRRPRRRSSRSTPRRACGACSRAPEGWRSWRPAWRTPTVRSARSARSRSPGPPTVAARSGSTATASTPAAVVDAVRGVGGEMLELRRLEGSLEDVFVHLTGRDLR